MKFRSLSFRNTVVGITISLASLVITSVADASVRQCAQIFNQPSRVVRQMDTMKVAAVQYPLGEGFTPAALLQKVEGYIDAAKANGAHLVVFPELMTTELVNWQATTSDIQQLRDIATNFTPMFMTWLVAQAESKQIAILGGTTPRLESNSRIVNTAPLALPDGRLLLQDKLFLTPDEKLWGWSPGESIRVFNTPWGRTAIAICFDCEMPMISQALSRSAPDLILVPSWTSSISGLNRVDWTARARAIEHYAYVVKTGTVPDATSTQSHHGFALIASPQDAGFPQSAIEGPMNQGAIVYGDLNLAQLRTQRPQSGYYPVGEQLRRQTPFRVEMVD